MTLPVKWFHSSMQSAPVLTAAAGAVINVLDACLLNGFNAKALTGLTRSGTAATATIAGGHGYQKYQGVLIAGADQPEYNGEFRITAVTSTTFTFEVSGTPASPATGTITVKTAPVGGWSKAFSGTNKAAYKSTDTGATGLYLRLDDSNTVSGWNSSGGYTNVLAYESMTDVDTGTGLWRSSSWWFKDTSSSNTTTAREWAVIADPRLFYLMIGNGYGNVNSYDRALYCFGDILSYRAGDAYHGYLQAGSNGISYGSAFANLPSTTYKVLARAYHQGPGSVAASMRGHGLSNYLGNGGLAFPNPADTGLYIHDQILVLDPYGVRGEMPGLKQFLHTAPVPHNVILDAIPSRPGALLLPLSVAYDQNGSSSLAQPLFDLAGPWR